MKTKGKALLVITATGSKWVPFDTHAFIQACSGSLDHRDCAQEDFSLLDTASLPLPKAAHKLKEGETVRVNIVFEFEHTTDYWGESDIDLNYLKERVLRKQGPRKTYFPKGRK